MGKKFVNSFSYWDYFIPYFYAFVLFLFKELDWISEEICHFNDGHTVSKFFVILVFMYIYSFVTMSFDVCYSSFIAWKTFLVHLAPGTPGCCSQKQLEDYCIKIFRIRIGGFQIFKILAALGFTELAILTWKIYFLFGLVCENYNPSSGQYCHSVMLNLCGDDTTEIVSPVCKKLIQHLPQLSYILLVVIMGNLIIPEIVITVLEKKVKIR